MNAIEIMNDEHRYITRMLKIVRTCCFKILKGEEVDYENFNQIIDFIMNFADKHHHRKEENVLFNRMVEEIGETAEKTINYGMLVEHDLGRLYIRSLREALDKVKNGDEEAKLDIIANAISYTHLLERHIDKEDRVIYKFAERELKAEVMENVNKDCIKFEEENSSERERCLLILKELEKKFL